MPSESVLKEKQLIVEQMTEKLKSQSGVFVDYSGISVIDDTALRVKMREANVEYKVVKNNLMRFAIKNVGFDELDSILEGTTSLAVCDDDPIAPARIIKEYADKFNGYFEIKAGFMDGKVLSASEVGAIASIPALPILQAQLLGTMLAPIAQLAVVLKAAAEKGGASVDVEVQVDEAPVEETADAVTPVEDVAEVATEAPAEEHAEAATPDATEATEQEATPAE
ncbi:MAG: 50S ribosomal protein L10 [Oscillospiraceae bacterium]|nr:50S ribosomal protein L10 [Oscillospiraceae bacterium]